MDDSYSTLDSEERSKAHGGGSDRMVYGGASAKSRNSEYGGTIF